METKKPQRRHRPEFRVEIATRMLAGENVSALSEKYQLPRSMMYRWRDALRREGAGGLSRPLGRPPGAAGPPAQTRPGSSVAEQRLRQQIAGLERKVGQQAVEIEFFRGVFKRLEELPKASQHGGAPYTRKSGE
jgi:transposase-like protein